MRGAAFIFCIILFNNDFARFCEILFRECIGKRRVYYKDQVTHRCAWGIENYWLFDNCSRRSVEENILSGLCSPRRKDFKSWIMIYCHKWKTISFNELSEEVSALQMIVPRRYSSRLCARFQHFCLNAYALLLLWYFRLSTQITLNRKP